jgi:hypothetical protein
MAARGPYKVNEAAPRARALRVLKTLIVTPQRLAPVLGISVAHAGMTLYRLWQQGYCHRWPYDNRTYYYRLREDYL